MRQNSNEDWNDRQTAPAPGQHDEERETADDEEEFDDDLDEGDADEFEDDEDVAEE